MALLNFWFLSGLALLSLIVGDPPPPPMIVAYLSFPAEPITYQAWLYDEVDKAFLRSLKEDSGWGDPATFLARREWVEALIPDTGNQRLAISHGDLNAWNVLADRSGLSG